MAANFSSGPQQNLNPGPSLQGDNKTDVSDKQTLLAVLQFLKKNNLKVKDIGSHRKMELSLDFVTISKKIMAFNTIAYFNIVTVYFICTTQMILIRNCKTGAMV